jgi:type I restriction enzyme S subunit
VSAALEEEPQTLSAGWYWTAMGEIADVVGGGTPRTNDPTNYEGGDVPWITPADLSGYTEKYISHGARFITRRGLESSSAQLVPEGTVLFTSRAPIGYVAIARNSVATNQGFKSFVLREGVLPEYVYWWLKGSKQLAEELASGTTFLELSGANAKKIPIPIAPLDQQRRIVAEIEKQFSRLDEAVTNLKRVKANLKRYKAAVLKAAVEGRLVPTEADLADPDGRSFETAAQLLARLLVARRIRWNGRSRYKEPVGPNLSEDFALPVGWTIASLDQLTSKITSGSRDWSKFYGRGSSIFVLGQNVRPLVPDFSVRQLVDPPKDDPSCDRSRVERGDLLTTIVGANTGQVCIVESAPKNTYVCQSVALIRPIDFAISPYLNYWLNSEEHGQRYFERCMYGQGRPHLSFEQLMATPVALPPIAEQLRIVAEVDRRLSLASEVDAQIDSDTGRANALRKSILGSAMAPSNSAKRMAFVEEQLA